MLPRITSTVSRVAPTATAPPRTGGPAEAGRAFSEVLREQPRPASPAPSGPLGPLARAPAAARSADAAIAPAAIEQHMARIVDSQRHLEAAMRRAMRGGQFSPQQLLALQFQVQKYSLEVEAVSRVVDRAVGSVKTALQTQI